MAKRVVLHVGAMKSGTTYLQSAVSTNRELLAERGLLLPGPTGAWGQVGPALNALGRTVDGDGGDLRGAWDRLAREAIDWPGTALISCELLAPAGPRQVDRIAASFGDTPVDVVLTLRDLNRTIAAMWQETVQNGRSWAWRDYLAGVELGRPGRADRPDELPLAARTFWRQQGAVRLARRWSRAGRVHVVTVPGPGAPPELLLQRFAEVVGFETEGMRPARRGNSSLGAAATEVLRRLNVVLDGRGLKYPIGRRVRKRLLAKTIMPTLAADDPRIGLPVSGWVPEQAAVTAARLRSLGAALHGDWADLEPVAVRGVDPAEVGRDVLARTAVEAYERLRRRLVTADRPARGDRAAHGEPPAWEPVAEVDADVDAAVTALADLVEWTVCDADPTDGEVRGADREDV